MAAFTVKKFTKGTKLAKFCHVWSPWCAKAQKREIRERGKGVRASDSEREGERGRARRERGRGALRNIFRIDASHGLKHTTSVHLSTAASHRNIRKNK